MHIRRIRVAAVIVRDGQILLMRRIKRGHEYFVFAGGGVDRGETLRQALKREIQEEFGLAVRVGRPIFKQNNRGQLEYYFLVTDFKGTPRLGGEEKAKMTERNQYYPVWKRVSEVGRLRNLFPVEAKQRVNAYLMQRFQAIPPGKD